MPINSDTKKRLEKFQYLLGTIIFAANALDAFDKNNLLNVIISSIAACLNLLAMIMFDKHFKAVTIIIFGLNSAISFYTAYTFLTINKTRLGITWLIPSILYLVVANKFYKKYYKAKNDGNSR